MPDFKTFNKIPRLSREIIITEKIDGTNALIYIGESGEFAIGSHYRWLTIQNDNSRFAEWAYQNKDELMKLGIGYHYGEWWGLGIQRQYNIFERRFSLFNVHKWSDPVVRPKCCHVVPILYTGLFDTNKIQETLDNLVITGSMAAPEFMKPEGIVIYHTAGKYLFKKTIENDEGKGEI